MKVVMLFGLVVLGLSNPAHAYRRHTLEKMAKAPILEVYRCAGSGEPNVPANLQGFWGGKDGEGLRVGPNGVGTLRQKFLYPEERDLTCFADYVSDEGHYVIIIVGRADFYARQTVTTEFFHDDKGNPLFTKKVVTRGWTLLIIPTVEVDHTFAKPQPIYFKPL